MAKTIYSTHWPNEHSQSAWNSGRIAGLFQVKEDRWDDDGPTHKGGPNAAIPVDFLRLDSKIIDYEEARQWPHP